MDDILRNVSYTGVAVSFLFLILSIAFACYVLKQKYIREHGSIICQHVDAVGGEMCCTINPWNAQICTGCGNTLTLKPITK